MQIPLAHTVCVDIHIHIGRSAFFVNLFETPKEFRSMILLKPIGTKIFENPLVALGDPVKGCLKGLLDRNFRILGFTLSIGFHTRAPGFESIRQNPPCRITTKPESILLFHGHKGEIPADLPRM